MKNVLFVLMFCFCSLVWAEPVATVLEIQQCRVRLTDSYNGEVLKPRIENDFKHGGYSANVKVSQSKKSYRFGFSLSCQASDDPDTKGGTYPIAYDVIKGEWKKDASAWENEAHGLADKDEQKALKELIHATKVSNVNAVNSQGWVMTQDDIIGDEKWRKRSLAFCLLHPPKAICGGGVVGALRDGPKGDLTQHALKIIQSIEFLPDTATSVEPRQ